MQLVPEALQFERPMFAAVAVRRWLARAWFLLALCVWAPVVHAHAALVASDPSDGAVLSAWPGHVALTFNEPISPLVFKLVSPDGVTRALERVEPIDGGLHIEFPAQTLEGTYALSWRVVSADGHPIGGTIVFSVGRVGVAGAPDVTDNNLRKPAIWLARLALYVGLFFGVGTALFRAFMGSADHAAPVWSRRTIRIGLAAVPICLLLQGLDALDAPWSDVFDAGVWRAALGTSYAVTLALTVPALSIALVTLSARNGRIRSGAATAVLLLGIALAASGHASAAPPQWLARPLVLLHGIAIAAWLGALGPLLARARRGNNEIVSALRTFSRRIRLVVIVLVLTGAALALLQVDRPASLWNTAYGQILLLKLLLVLGLFMLAAWNRYRLTDRVLGGDGQARLVLGRIIAVEIALALCVLAVVALWRFTPPPRALTLTLASPPTPTVITTRFKDAGVTVQFDYTPARSGQPGSLRMILTDAQSAPLSPKAVTVSFSNPVHGLEPLQREAAQRRPGEWEISPLNLPAAARWDVRIEMLVTDFDRISLQGRLEMAPGKHSH